MAENNGGMVWVIDETNQRGNEVYVRDVLKTPLPRQAAEAAVRCLKIEYPHKFYAVREGVTSSQ